MRKFDYTFLKKISVPADIMNSATSIYEMKAKAELRRTDFADVFSAMESVAKIQSVKSSNAIEGIVTSDERIAAIVNQNSAPLNHNEAEIAGYRDALNEIHLGYEHIDFRQSDILRLHETMMSFAGYEYGGQYKTDEKSILELHRMLLQPSGDDLAGKYKTEDNFIMETDRRGVRSVRFTPVPASETSAAMEQLILAYHATYSESEINPMLLIPCVILDFLCIHPFRDGNGRMSRLLSLLLLYKSGFSAGKYVSIEEQINTYKNYYYTSLQKSSERWHENDNSYFPFIENFLFNLKMSYFELDSRFANFKDKKITKKQRIEDFITGSLLPVSKRDICDKLPDISVTTVEVELGRLLKSGEIEKIGNGRGTKYRAVIKAE